MNVDEKELAFNNVHNTISKMHAVCLHEMVEAYILADQQDDQLYKTMARFEKYIPAKDKPIYRKYIRALVETDELYDIFTANQLSEFFEKFEPLESWFETYSSWASYMVYMSFEAVKDTILKKTVEERYDIIKKIHAAYTVMKNFKELTFSLDLSLDEEFISDLETVLYAYIGLRDSFAETLKQKK